MKMLRSQQGYALLIAVLLLTLISVIGISLLALTSNGTARNGLREDMTQATEQAEKGINHITAEIQKKLELTIPTLDKYDANIRTKFDSQFDSILSPYLCSQPQENHLTQGDANLNYSVCLDEIPQNDDPLKVLTFTSIGTADEEQSTLKSEIQLGANLYEYPDFLNFAVATHDEGNLIMNGGIDILGDVRADGNIVISDSGYAPFATLTDSSFIELNNNIWVNSTYPNIHGPTQFPTTTKEAKLFINPNHKLFDIYTEATGCTRPSYLIDNINTQLNNLGLNLNMSLYLPDRVTYYDLESYDFNHSTNECLYKPYQLSQINDFLSTDHKPDLEETSSVGAVDIERIISEGKAKMQSLVVKNSYNDYRNILGGMMPIMGSMNNKNGEPLSTLGIITSLESKPQVKGSYKLLTNSVPGITDYTLDGDFYFHNSNISLSAGGNNTLLGYYYFDKTFLDQRSIWITGGNQTLNGQFFLEKGLLGDAFTIFGGNHTIKGTYYVNGDVEITQTNINADAVLYVNGDVHIDHATIKGIENPDGSRGKLIIFATGDIIYNYASELGTNIGKKYYNEDQLVLDAYLYANDKIELHGTLSNLKVRGGIAANRLLLSGIRGDVSNNLLPKMENPDDLTKPSRLVIEFDKDTVLAFSRNNTQVKYTDLVLQPIFEMSRELR